MEACGTAHHWDRVAQDHGHRVSWLPVRYVKPYLRGNKTDRTDVDALLDAVRTGAIPPVHVKTVAQQEIVALHLGNRGSPCPLGRRRRYVAVANKLARLVWAVWARDVPYRATPVAA